MSLKKAREHLLYALDERLITEEEFLLLYEVNIVNRGNGYETRQSSLLYVFVLFFGLDPAQNTIVVYSVLRN